MPYDLNTRKKPTYLAREIPKISPFFKGGIKIDETRKEIIQENSNSSPLHPCGSTNKLEHVHIRCGQVLDPHGWYTYYTEKELLKINSSIWN